MRNYFQKLVTGWKYRLSSVQTKKQEPNEQENDFLCFFSEEMKISAIRSSTRKNHLSTLMLLQSFRQPVPFSALTCDFLMQFDNFMNQKGLHPNTVAKHMKQLKRYVNLAVSKKHLSWQQYPFRYYRIRTVMPHHSYLSPDELVLLEELKLGGKSIRLRKSLDAFLFCCYTGLRYSDFTHLNAGCIMEVDGLHWLAYRSVKTGIHVRLPLSLLFNGKAVGILDRYKPEQDVFFHLKDNSNVNKDLQRLAKLAGIDKRISFHTARHTNATLLIYQGANITTVQRLLGHKSIKTTQLYTEIMDRTLIRDLQKCFS